MFASIAIIVSVSCPYALFSGALPVYMFALFHSTAGVCVDMEMVVVLTAKRGQPWASDA